MIKLIKKFRDYRQSTSLNFIPVHPRTGIINNIAISLRRLAPM